jgi:cytochrome P450
MTIGSHTAPGSPAPCLDIDLYADDVLADSRDAFARIRHSGSAVWLPRHRMYAMGRFDDVRAALRDPETFISGDGVAGNRLSNRLGRGTTLFSDGQLHDSQRRILRQQLGPTALEEIKDRVETHAERIVTRCCGGDSFDVVRDFSSQLPIGVVAELVGVRGGSERMLRWAAATFDLLGPLNRRAIGAMRSSLGLLLYTLRLGAAGVSPRSWAAAVFDARDRGQITTRQARGLVIDLVAPSLDTTILASTHLLWVLSRNPDVWDEIVADPSLISAAVVENVRIASPIRGFTRRLSRDHEIDGTPLPQGSRVLLLFGAANLDETRFPNPESYDIHRPNGAHLGWGNGPHACAGANLAKLEMQVLLRAMAPHVRHIATSNPTRLRNNTLQGFSGLTARFS